ncbi:MAG: right-handed parallel beta-helix repeat-containing protein [Phycisphaerales bacterium]
MKNRIAILAVLALTIPCAATVFTVDDDGPADFQSIQAAIDASWHGDTIVVKQGTYNEQISFGGRQITVRSDEPDDATTAENTVIAGGTDASVVFDFGEGEESVLTGFTITGAGIVCIGASPTVRGNVIRDCTGVGIKGQDGAKPTILGNQILGNTLEGIHSCDGLIQGNTISGNNAGVAFCDGSILDNTISDNADAGGLYSCSGEIAGNTITGNYAATEGAGLFDCTGLIHNNIIAGNRAGTQGGGLYACTKAIYNNTIVGNRAGEAGGAVSQCPTTLYNNIIAFNEAPAGAGLYGVATNTYNAFYSNAGGNFGGGAASGSGDMSIDPRFASNGHWEENDASTDDDDSWVDGDYHLRSQTGRWDPNNRQWATDSDTSRCIDVGDPSSNWAAELWPHGERINLGAYGGTRQASMSQSDAGLPADVDHDEKVGPLDLMTFCLDWQTADAPVAADLNRRGTVDFNDFAVFAMEWRTGAAAQTPPVPSPMTFAMPPAATGPYSIAMVATSATSTDGTGVEYYFEDYFSPAFNSGWLSYEKGEEPRWEDVGLEPRTLYWYRVKARNRGNQLETKWSERFAATTSPEDLTVPAPSPMTWQTEPYAVSSSSIRMVATTATDDSGVEYWFECTSHSACSSGWQESATYEVTGLAKGYYTFRVWARDKSPNHNTTASSTEIAVDLLPPTPDPMTWASAPKEVQGTPASFNNYYATMTATEATDDSGTVEYLFQCTTESAFSSGWQTSPEYSVKVGRAGQQHRFRVKARDTSPNHNETGWSPELAAK